VLDKTGLAKAYLKIAVVSEYERALSNAIELAVVRLVLLAPHFTQPSQLRVFLILFQNPLLTKSENYIYILKKLIRAVICLSPKMQKVLSALFGHYSPQDFEQLVHVMNHAINIHMSPDVNTYGASEEVRNACLVLKLLYTINEEKKILPFHKFYNEYVNDKIGNLKEDYKRWKESWKNNKSKKDFSVFDFPFLLNPITKGRILHIDSFLEMSSHVESAITVSVVSEILMLPGGRRNSDGASQIWSEELISKATATHFTVNVRREYLLTDTINQISQKLSDLKKPLRVKFVGEEGVDQGGVQKEFFQLLVQQLFDLNFGLWVYNEEQRYFWFNPNSLEDNSLYQFIGIIMGLAIYNGVILDVHFPLVLYKKLLGHSPTFQDLKEFNPGLAHGLQQLLDYQGDVTDFETYFEITVPQLDGSKNVVDLLQIKKFRYKQTQEEQQQQPQPQSQPQLKDPESVFLQIKEPFPILTTNSSNNNNNVNQINDPENWPKGADTLVTNSNRSEYVDLYVDYILNYSVEKQFKAFYRGFHLVCGGDALKLCRPEEVEQLLCGSPHLDFNELQQSAKYVDYTPDDPIIKWLWEILHAMDSEDKKKFLLFVTGTDRAPLHGLAHTPIKIQRNGPDSHRLPTAHTCFSLLLLPQYSSKEKLLRLLTTAIQNYQGFGLA